MSIFKNSTLFRECITQMNNIYMDNIKHIDFVMWMYKLMEHNDNYSKKSGRLCQYHREKANDNITNFESFKFKAKITRKAPNDDIPMVPLSTQDNAKLLQQIKSTFKRTTNWNRYYSKTKHKVWNHYFNHLVDPRFQGINKVSVFSLKEDANRSMHTNYFLAKVN